MNAHFQPPGHGAAPRAANADKTWAPGARRTFPATTRTVAMLMAVVLATACGGGNDSAPTPAPTPAAPTGGVDSYTGDWVSETCQGFGDGPTRDVLRITRATNDQMDVQLLQATYPGANCSGTPQLGNVVSGTRTERTTLAATESAGEFLFNRGLAVHTYVTPSAPSTSYAVGFRSIWIPVRADRLCALADLGSVVPTGSPPQDNSYYGSAADVAAAQVEYAGSACFTRLTDNAPGAAQPLPTEGGGERLLNTLFQERFVDPVGFRPPDAACHYRQDGGSERYMFRFLAPTSPFVLTSAYGTAVFGDNASCQGEAVFWPDANSDRPRQLHLLPAQDAGGVLANKYRADYATDNTFLGLMRVQGAVYLQPGLAWPCDTGAQALLFLGGGPLIANPEIGPLLPVPPSDAALAETVGQRAGCSSELIYPPNMPF